MKKKEEISFRFKKENELNFVESSSINIFSLDVLIHEEDTKILLGRPVISIISDNSTDLITGISITFGKPSWDGVIGALYNCKENKVALCLKHNINITQNDWPTSPIPKVICLDKGYLKGNNCKLLKQLDIRIRIVPYIFSKSKSERIVNKLKRLIEQNLLEWRENKGDTTQPNIVSPMELRKGICRAIVYYNISKVKRQYLRNPL